MLESLKNQTKQRHLHRKAAFCSINSVHGLCRMLKIEKRKLLLLAQKPPYKVFTIPKKNGGERQIEAPGADLKSVLRKLNIYLQSVYYFEKSSAAYGFIVGVSNDEDRRNVVTNAKKHIGNPYLLNLDLKNFFHYVTRDMVLDIFLKKPFNFKRELPDLLADLLTYDGRLPMGTPTSPVLSNLACRALDRELSAFANDMLWAYTRYADDMSFSSKQFINEEMVQSVRAIIRSHKFEPNLNKEQLFDPDEEKIVTGLLVTDKVTLAPGFLDQVRTDITELAAIVKAQNEEGQLNTRWVEDRKRQVRGRLNFAGFVLKRNNAEYMELKDAFYTAIHPPQEEFHASSWRGFPYNL